MEDDGEEDEAGRMTDSPRRFPVVAGCWLMVRWWRSGEPLAMVWTVMTADRTEEREGTGEDVGGILRPCSLSSFPSACFCFFSLYIIRYI